MFASFACIFIAAGIGIAASQARKLNGYLATPATVTGANVQERHGESATYAPLAHFTFQVDGTAHAAHTPFPLDTSSDGSWASADVGRYHPGQQVTAWYNPEPPEHACLERVADVVPYLLILHPMLRLCAGLRVWWFAVSAGPDPTGKVKGIGGLATLWWLVGILAAAHVASLGGAFLGLALGAFGIYAVIGIGLRLGWSAMARKSRVAGSLVNAYAPTPD
jgi:hypothetical protein